jgi:hypothetical protein
MSDLGPTVQLDLLERWRQTVRTWKIDPATGGGRPASLVVLCKRKNSFMEIFAASNALEGLVCFLLETRTSSIRQKENGLSGEYVERKGHGFE